jgi:hypothetical protein
VTASDLDEPASIGRNRVDHLAFATRHPSAQLTRPGDVIFRTSPTAAAWVDTDGSKVVAYPARVLRITLIPAVSCPRSLPQTSQGRPPDRERGSGGCSSRRPAHDRTAPTALADIETARRDLEARAARLTDYAALIVAGATSGAVTMIDVDHAADAADTQ